jgi:hypothetical protein
MQKLSPQHSGSDTASLEMTGVNSRAASWKPYYATLPAYGSLKSMHNFPASYLPLLQHTELVSRVQCLWSCVGVLPCTQAAGCASAQSAGMPSVIPNQPLVEVAAAGMIQQLHACVDPAYSAVGC